jgi:hypothetical protein
MAGTTAMLLIIIRIDQPHSRHRQARRGLLQSNENIQLPINLEFLRSLLPFPALTLCFERFATCYSAIFVTARHRNGSLDI